MAKRAARRKRNPRFDIDLMRLDMYDRGWFARDLANEAGVHEVTVSRFLTGRFQSPRTAAQLAKALGHDVSRYRPAREAA